MFFSCHPCLFTASQFDQRFTWSKKAVSDRCISLCCSMASPWLDLDIPTSSLQETMVYPPVSQWPSTSWVETQCVSGDDPTFEVAPSTPSWLTITKKMVSTLLLGNGQEPDKWHGRYGSKPYRCILDRSHWIRAEGGRFAHGVA